MKSNFTFALIRLAMQGKESLIFFGTHFTCIEALQTQQMAQGIDLFLAEAALISSSLGVISQILHALSMSKPKSTFDFSADLVFAFFC